MVDGRTGGRRERVRAATVLEIKETARRLLVESGPAGVSLRAIAREMGMTAPGLYRYFPSHEELWEALCHDLYDELADALERDLARLPDEVAEERLLTAARAFRAWAVNRPREFQLVFGMPLPDVARSLDASPESKTGLRFAEVFIRAFVDLWRYRPFDVPPDDGLPPGLVRQLDAYRTAIASAVPGAGDLPIGAIQIFLQGWVQLYGAVTLEVFGHLGFCLDDPAPFFEVQLLALARMFGLTGPLPPPRP